MNEQDIKNLINKVDTEEVVAKLAIRCRENLERQLVDALNSKFEGKSVKSFLEFTERPVSLMTPAGYVDVDLEQIKAILEGNLAQIDANAGFSDAFMPVDVLEFLNYEISRFSYSAEKGTFYLVVGD